MAPRYRYHADTPTCGAATNVCAHCYHHEACHRDQKCREFKGARQPCRKMTQSQPCDAFSAVPCGSRALMRNGRCKTHSGNAPKGMAAPGFKHGAYSKYLPPDVQALWETLQSDPARLSLEQEINVLRVQLTQVLRETYEAQTRLAPDAIRAAATAIRQAYRAFVVANRTGDTPALGRALDAWSTSLQELESALSPMAALDEGRRKQVHLSLALDRLKRTENSVRLAERGTVALESVMLRERALIEAWKDALDATVRDVETRTAVLAEIARRYAEFAGRRDHPSAPAARPAALLDAEYSASTD